MARRALVVTPAQGEDEDLGYVSDVRLVGGSLDQVIVVGGTNHEAFVLASSNAVDFERRRALSSGLRSVVGDADASGDYIYMVGEYGLAARSADLGLTWEQLDTGTSGCLFAIERAGDGTLWCVG